MKGPTPEHTIKRLRDKRVIHSLLQEIEKRTKTFPSPVHIMEVCGTHTMTVHKYGLKKMLRKAGIEMLSGPGCPVCITPGEIHEAAIELVTNRENLLLTTFGDMTRVPTEKGSLQTVVPASGSMIKIVYSPMESLELARENPENEVVFFGVGFETTIPSIALTVKKAQEEGMPNFSVLSAFFLIPPPLKAIVEAEDTSIDGFLYPGHVSVIIGIEPYRFIAEEFGIAGAITGFEPVDILLSTISILEQINKGKPVVANEYSRVVRPSGNSYAQSVIHNVLEVKDALWRGLGLIPQSGLNFRKKYSGYDAEVKFKMNIKARGSDLPGCRCGEVLRGKILPPQCSLFAKKCTPNQPYGPCMVSYEGACLAYYKYDR
jgi:hydrogenase expression/formation protein HypD